MSVLARVFNKPFKAPTVQRFTTSGTATYILPSPRPKYIVVKALGGGGGGGGSGTTAGSAAHNGCATSFGTIVIASGGLAGARDGNEGENSANTITSPAIQILSISGQNPGMAARQGAASASTGPLLSGAAGGNSVFGGGGYGGMPGQSGVGGAGRANTGGGGGSAYASNTAGNYTGNGGVAGNYVEVFIPNPDISYALVIGGGGGPQAAGTSGSAGGAGGSGVIIVEEYYQ